VTRQGLDLGVIPDETFRPGEVREGANFILSDAVERDRTSDVAPELEHHTPLGAAVVFEFRVGLVLAIGPRVRQVEPIVCQTDPDEGGLRVVRLDRLGSTIDEGTAEQFLLVDMGVDPQPLRNEVTVSVLMEGEFELDAIDRVERDRTEHFRHRHPLMTLRPFMIAGTLPPRTIFTETTIVGIVAERPTTIRTAGSETDFRIRFDGIDLGHRRAEGTSQNRADIGSKTTFSVAIVVIAHGMILLVLWAFKGPFLCVELWYVPLSH